MASAQQSNRGLWQGWRLPLALLIVAVCVAGGFVLRYAIKDGYAKNLSDDAHANMNMFTGWGNPDLVLVLTAQMHGYLQPCGCSRPQFGGLSRRYNFIQSIKDKGWPVVAMDLGDVAQSTGATFEQRQLKYSTAMKALDLMNYTAVGIGSHEFGYPLFEALSCYSLNNPTPVVVAANLMNRQQGELFHNLGVKSSAISQGDKGPKVGIVGLIGPSVIYQVKDPDAKFSNNNAYALQQSLIQLQAQKAEVFALLYQGTPDEAKRAAEYFYQQHQADPRIPALDVILCLSEASEPPSLPKMIGKTMVVELGHKGRYVGLVGVFGGSQRQLKYQLASIGEEYEEANNPVKKLMQDYANEVKRNKYAVEFARTKHPIHVNFPQAKYIGSERCGDCHQHAFQVWQGSKHAHAFDTLKKATDPSLREYDGECVKCHVVGFGYHTGYLDARNGERENKRLQHVGCETCHGPGSAHANDPNDKNLRALMNPYKTNIPNLPEHVVKHRLNLTDMSCQRCHDTDNDVHWTFNKWMQIIHMTPALPAAAPAPPAGNSGGDPAPAAKEKE